jgi:hypothetical protein
MNYRTREEWIIAVLYLAGLGAGQISSGPFLRGASSKVQVRNIIKQVKATGLEVMRSGPERAKALAVLDRAAPEGLERFVPRCLAKLSVQAQAKLKAGVEDKALRDELLIRTRLAAQVESIAAGFRQTGATPPDAYQEVTMPDRKTTVRVNVTQSPIEYLYRRNKIPQFAYEAANKMLRDWTTAEIGGLQAFDPSKDIVDTSLSVIGLTDGKLDAMQRLGAVRMSLRHGYASERDRARMETTVWKYVIEQSPGRVWIGRIREPILPVLIDGLEHVAWVYGLAPNGPISKHLQIVFGR